MSNAGLIFSLVLSIVTILLIALPFVTRRQAAPTSQPETLESLQAQYQRVLTNIHDIDEDFSIGKISEAFRDSEREKYVATGVALLKQIEAFSPKQANKSKKSAPVPDSKTHDDAIEAAIAAYRKQLQ